MQEERTAADWRTLSGAGPDSQPPEWIYQRRIPLRFCVRYLHGRNMEGKLLSIYNGYGTLLGFDQVETVVAQAFQPALARRLVESVRYLKDVENGAFPRADGIRLQREELMALGQDLIQRVLSEQRES